MQFKAIYVSSGCLLSLLAVGGLVSLQTDETRGQETGDPAASTVGEVNPDTKGYIGSAGCVQCHRGLSPALDSDSFVPLTEPAVWLTDPHSKAFEFIAWDAAADASTESASQQLSREICRKLGIADIHNARECLSCHANWVANLEEKPTLYKLGVACESCHGPADEWEREHARQEWRTRSIDYKSARKMVDVRNPVQRAEQCFSCHIGNVQQGKWLTHKMYAAGHPPLPGIEIESFARQMPRHWRYLKEKIADSRQREEAGAGDAPPFKFFSEFVEQNHGYLSAQDAEQRRKIAERHNHGAAAVVLGGAVALREAIELACDLAARDLATRDLAAPESTQQSSWPELAVLDCTACHHDLKRDNLPPASDNQRRPGRPSLPAWPTALVQLAIFHVSDSGNSDRVAAYRAKSQEFTSMLTAVENNFWATPFGDPARLKNDATALSQWLTDELIIPVAAKPFDDQAVQLAARRLAHLGSQDGHDYDSARQIAWALRTIYCDLDEKPAADTKIQMLFGQLAANLRLDLPNGSGESCETAPTAVAADNTGPPDTAPADVPLPLTSQIPTALATEVQYDPEQFRDTMRRLQRLLN